MGNNSSPILFFLFGATVGAGTVLLLQYRPSQAHQAPAQPIRHQTNPIDMSISVHVDNYSPTMIRFMRRDPQDHQSDAGVEPERDVPRARPYERARRGSSALRRAEASLRRENGENGRVVSPYGW
ncbi:hypothetical protein OPT61_g3567 [Boeremia exigua]|uniref:Uncharacterized protein n=1 Tax=Boeremia exigua TaxID=749465 RepID=A0ACC2IHI4_9PLEO|nr:hypothetical protein OPT61_g3567 [Boeremia exigua]